MFGIPDPNSLPGLLGKRMAPGMIPGPVGTQPPPPSGFRPPGAGGAPGMAPQGAQPQMPGMGMDPMAMAMLAGMMQPGGNEQQVNKTLDAAPPGGNSDPMAQGAAQAADMGRGSFGSWWKNLGLF